MGPRKILGLAKKNTPAGCAAGQKKTALELKNGMEVLGRDYGPPGYIEYSRYAPSREQDFGFIGLTFARPQQKFTVAVINLSRGTTGDLGTSRRDQVLYK